MKAMLLMLFSISAMAQSFNPNDLINPIYIPEPGPNHGHGPYRVTITETEEVKVGRPRFGWNFIYEAGQNVSIPKGAYGGDWQFPDARYTVTLALRVDDNLNVTDMTCYILAGREYSESRTLSDGSVVRNHPLIPNTTGSIRPDNNGQVTISRAIEFTTKGIGEQTLVDSVDITVPLNLKGSFKLLCKTDVPVNTLDSGHFKIKTEYYHEEFSKADTSRDLPDNSWTLGFLPIGTTIGVPEHNYGNTIEELLIKWEGWASTINHQQVEVGRICNIVYAQPEKSIVTSQDSPYYGQEVIIDWYRVSYELGNVQSDSCKPTLSRPVAILRDACLIGGVNPYTNLCVFDRPLCPDDWDYIDGSPVGLGSLCKKFTGFDA